MGIIRGRRAVGTAEAGNGRAFTAPLLSFVWPGLGQAHLGWRRRAALQALVGFALVAFLAVQFMGGPERFVLRLLVPSFAAVVILVIALHGFWRSFSIADAWRASRSAGPLRSDAALPLVVVLVAGVLASHLFAGVFIYDYNQAGQLIDRKSVV